VKKQTSVRLGHARVSDGSLPSIESLTEHVFQPEQPSTFAAARPKLKSTRFVAAGEEFEQEAGVAIVDSDSSYSQHAETSARTSRKTSAGRMSGRSLLDLVLPYLESLNFCSTLREEFSWQEIKRSSLSVLAMIQSFVGFFAMLFALYVFGSGMERSYGSMTLVLGGLTVLAFGFTSFSRGAFDSRVHALILFLASVIAEAVTFIVIRAVSRNSSYVLVLVVCGAHGLAVIFSLASALVLLVSVHRERLRKLEGAVLVRKLREDAKKRADVTKMQHAAQSIEGAIRYTKTLHGFCCVCCRL
jgi:hypothetical protein